MLEHGIPPGVDSLEMLHQMAKDNRKQGAFKLGGAFQFDHFRKGHHIDRWYQPNIMMQEGLEYALGVALVSTTQITAWYMLLKDNTADPLSGVETYAVPLFVEITDYDETIREVWTGGSITGTTTQSVSNSGAPAEYTIDTTVTVYGSALVGGGTPTVKGDVAGGGTLLCGANFAASKPLVDNDTLQVTYTNTTTDDGV